MLARQQLGLLVQEVYLLVQEIGLLGQELGLLGESEGVLGQHRGQVCRDRGSRRDRQGGGWLGWDCCSRGHAERSAVGTRGGRCCIAARAGPAVGSHLVHLVRQVLVAEKDLEFAELAMVRIWQAVWLRGWNWCWGRRWHRSGHRSWNWCGYRSWHGGRHRCRHGGGHVVVFLGWGWSMHPSRRRHWCWNYRSWCWHYRSLQTQHISATLHLMWTEHSVAVPCDVRLLSAGTRNAAQQ